MTDEALFARAQALIESLDGDRASQRRYIALAMTNRAEDGGSEMRDNIEWLGYVSAAAQLDAAPNSSLAVVLLDDDTISAKQAAEVLGRLRDGPCERVMVADSVGSVLTVRDYLALGYLRREGNPQEPACYLHDPEEFYPAREWNNGEQWAHPQNYDRYRW